MSADAATAARAWLDTWPGVLRNEPLYRHSQFGIGGPADWFLSVADEAVLCDLLPRCAVAGVPVTVAGAGSNTLVLDGGIRGVVIRLTSKRLTVVDGETVELSGACMMPRAALDCARFGLAGLEFGIGVPGTCGASVAGNAGAFGGDVAGVLVSCTSIGDDGRVHADAAGDCGLAYRRSRFQGEWAGRVVTSARFRVRSGDANVRARTDAVQQERKATQPYGVRSLGSTFKNPPGDHAGRLIDAAGLKGRRAGGAVISPKHANFILNVDRASAADVLALVDLMHDTVAERFGVLLEREIIIAGEPPALRR